MAPPRELPGWAPRVGVAIALAALVVWSFVERWNVLASSPFPLGVDGYFYPVQLRALLESGELQYPASPLAFWLMLPFAWATDPITGAKLGAAVWGALIAVPAYGVGAQLGRDGDDRGRGAGLVTAVIATTSAGSMYLTIEFVKNGIGLTVALTALWLVLRALETPVRPRVIAAIAAIVAALLAHKMAAAIVIGIAVPAAIVEAHRRGALRGRKARPLAIALGVAAVLLVAGLLMPQRFLSPADLALLDGLFRSEADWSLPVFAPKLVLDREPLICAVVGVLAAAGLLLDGRRASRLATATLHTRAGAGRDAAAWGVLALAAVIALPWLDTSSSQGLAMRLRVIAFVPLALVAAVIVRVASRYVARWIGDAFPVRSVVGVVIAIVIVAIRASGGPHTEGRVLTHPALIASAQAATGRLPEAGVAIVQERHIAFMLAWYARLPIAMRSEPIAEDRRYRVMPLAFIRMDSPLDRELLAARDRGLLVIGLHPLHPNGMVIVPEATWRDVLARLPPADRIRLAAWPTI